MSPPFSDQDGTPDFVPLRSLIVKVNLPQLSVFFRCTRRLTYPNWGPTPLTFNERRYIT